MSGSGDGRIFQLEYALKVLENSDTIVGVKCKDGVILASEKQLHSRLLKEDSNHVLKHIDTHIGVAMTGHIPDCKNVIHRAKKEAESYRDNYGIPITGRLLAERMSLYIHAHTLYSYYRPLGVGIIIAAVDNEEFQLYMVDSSGTVYAYNGCTMGKGRQITRTELEKHKFNELTVEEALPLVARMIVLSHKEMREKRFELEVSTITAKTNFVHKLLDKEKRKALEQSAEELVEKEMMEE